MTLPNDRFVKLAKWRTRIKHDDTWSSANFTLNTRRASNDKRKEINFLQLSLVNEQDNESKNTTQHGIKTRHRSWHPTQNNPNVKNRHCSEEKYQVLQRYRWRMKTSVSEDTTQSETTDTWNTSTRIKPVLSVRVPGCQKLQMTA